MIRVRLWEANDRLNPERIVGHSYKAQIDPAAP